jgi:transposase
LTNWTKQADIEDGRCPGLTDADRAERRIARKRSRLLEQENKVLRRAAA